MLPQTSYLDFRGPTSKGKGKGRERKGGEGEDKGRKGKAWKERKKGEWKEGEGKGWGGEEAGSVPQAKAWPHQNYFPGAGAESESQSFSIKYIALLFILYYRFVNHWSS